MRRIAAVVSAALFMSTFGASSAWAKGHQPAGNDQAAATGKGPASPTDTVTYWCTNLNDLWHVDYPVIAAYWAITNPDPSPIPDPCGSGFPVLVPNGSRFMPGGTYMWFTNKTYPPIVRAGLEAAGYHFNSQSPAEDFLSKMVKIRVEVWTLDWSTLVAEYSFDPHKYFKLVQKRDYDGKFPQEAYVNPDVGIDMSAEEVGRLPLFGFPVNAGPLPPSTPSGMYWASVYWTLSEEHNDGMGLDWFNFIAAGEFLYGDARFFVP